MKEIPILFSIEMVQAILEGRKTMTRRAIKHQPSNLGVAAFNDREHPQMKCPYGQPGDILWVRETFIKGNSMLLDDTSKNYYIFKDGSQKFSSGEYFQRNECRTPGPWKPSIHMPKEACRIKLLVKSVKVERLWHITEEDAIAEGVTRDGHGNCYVYTNYLTSQFSYNNAKSSFKSLWGSINGKESWDENPWVWVIEFERV